MDNLLSKTRHLLLLSLQVISTFTGYTEEYFDDKSQGFSSY